MRLIAVLSALVWANIALGAPFTERRRARAAKRAEAGALRSGASLPRLPRVHVEGGASYHCNSSVQVEYSSNWAGAVLIGSGYSSVTGTFVVPTPSAPSGGTSDTQYAASAWVGIDGDTAQNSILQTGVDFFIQGDEVSYDAWYEWYPDYAYNFDDITISGGDTMTITVTATSSTGGTATVENVSSGQKVSHSFSSQSNALQELNAEWIVEDFSEGDSLVPFADFGTVTFTDATATTGSGTVGPDGATIIDIEQNSQVLTSVSISGNGVAVTYSG